MLAVALHRKGGVADIGSEGRGYVGGPLDEGLASGDGIISPETSAADSF